jgi:hypothetical protein
MQKHKSGPMLPAQGVAYDQQRLNQRCQPNRSYVGHVAFSSATPSATFSPEDIVEVLKTILIRKSSPKMCKYTDITSRYRGCERAEPDRHAVRTRTYRLCEHPNPEGTKRHCRDAELLGPVGASRPKLPCPVRNGARGLELEVRDCVGRIHNVL